jgi:hypothetical protein
VRSHILQPVVSLLWGPPVRHPVSYGFSHIPTVRTVSHKGCWYTSHAFRKYAVMIADSTTGDDESVSSQIPNTIYRYSPTRAGSTAGVESQIQLRRRCLHSIQRSELVTTACASHLDTSHKHRSWEQRIEPTCPVTQTPNTNAVLAHALLRPHITCQTFGFCCWAMLGLCSASAGSRCGTGSATRCKVHLQEIGPIDVVKRLMYIGPLCLGWDSNRVLLGFSCSDENVIYS